MDVQDVTCSPGTGTDRGGQEQEEAKALRSGIITSPCKRTCFLFFRFLIYLSLKKENIFQNRYHWQYQDTRKFNDLLQVFCWCQGACGAHAFVPQALAAFVGAAGVVAFGFCIKLPLYSVIQTIR